ncbi:MAG: urea ABC transporter permease subunit UrtB [Verrucomicrobia bacterium]|nr:urea ABC transporter permease subunit UrtB [Verrucomicrobiota bacterium]
MLRTLSIFLFLLAAAALSAAPDASRARLLAALVAPADQQVAAVRALVGLEDAALVPTLTAWRAAELYLVTTGTASPVPALLAPLPGDADGRLQALAVADGLPVKDPATGQPLTFAPKELKALDTTAPLRRAIRDVLEVAGVADPSPAVRRESIERLGQSRKADHLPLLQARLAIEFSPAVRSALQDAIAFIQLADPAVEVRLQAITDLAAAHSLAAAARFKEQIALPADAPGAASPVELAALKTAVKTIEDHWSRVNFFGNLFRGLSAGSVLLLIALGLAITFGLMGVINMAHGELMVVGAYATFVVQNLFAAAFGPGSLAFNFYFLAALPVAFAAAALVGLVIERGVIQFLYKRPLESLLATWGVSLALQQTFRLVFGPANVQINAPAWLQGGTALYDVAFAYNRLFVIGFAVLVVFGVWLVLNRTPLGLLVRAVMQNRQMASCIGVKTTRVNMLTFAFGSGLAGLAGACLSQLGNVGPGMGQLHIIDAFMVVVSGGVGNVLGSVAASLGIGVTDQLLQPVLGAVMGKILVLFAIILFLQWRPGGLFPTRSRSLD